MVRDPIQSAPPFSIDQFWWPVFQHIDLSDIDLSIFERALWIRPSSPRGYIPPVSKDKENKSSQVLRIKHEYHHLNEIQVKIYLIDLAWFIEKYLS